MIPEDLSNEIYAFMVRNWGAIVLVSICTVVALFSLLFGKPDNSIEQASEKQIEGITGLKVDFSQ